MELNHLTVSEFLDTLASRAPAPGGGSAAALFAAAGAALTAMVSGLSVGKASCPDQELVTRAEREAGELSARLASLAEEDTDAFLRVSAAYAMPKATGEEKSARRAAIQAGLARCTETPLAVMELAAECLALLQKLAGRTNPNAASDLGVAALGLRAAVQGAYLNVRINAGSIRDERFREDAVRRAQTLLEHAEAAADRLYADACAACGA